MKKVIIIGIVLILVISIVIISIVAYSSLQYEGWQTIDIEKCGTLKIPSEWLYYEEDGFIYITYQNLEPIMIQTYSYSGKHQGDEESNKYFNDIVNLETLSGTVYSNGAYYGKSIIMQDGEQSEKLFVDIGYERRVLLIIWDETIDEKFVQKVAKSFVAY